MISEMQNDASFSALANLLSFDSGLKQSTHWQVSQVKSLWVSWSFVEYFVWKWRSSTTMRIQYKTFDVKSLELTCNVSLFLVITVFDPGLTRDTSSLSMNSLIAHTKVVSVSVEDLEFDRVTSSSIMNNVISPFDIELLKKCLLFIFVCGDKLFKGLY